MLAVTMGWSWEFFALVLCVGLVGGAGWAIAMKLLSR
jgi:hypothetical protein